MKVLEISTPIGIGDLIYLKGMLDPICHLYDKIIINFAREIIPIFKLDINYNIFLNEIGALLFSDKKYYLVDKSDVPLYGLKAICNLHKIIPVKPNLIDILCDHSRLSINEDYIVIVTKTRQLSKKFIENNTEEMWNIINELSKKYKIVILGERNIQMNFGYEEIGSDYVYSIYNYIKKYIKEDKIIDLSISELGVSAPHLDNIKKDCSIMNRAKFVLTLGIGGGFCLATAVSNKIIGYRDDTDQIADEVFSKDYPDAIVTKNWTKFINTLQEYL